MVSLSLDYKDVFGLLGKIQLDRNISKPIVFNRGYCFWHCQLRSPINFKVFFFSTAERNFAAHKGAVCAEAEIIVFWVQSFRWPDSSACFLCWAYMIGLFIFHQILLEAALKWLFTLKWWLWSKSSSIIPTSTTVL